MRLIVQNDAWTALTAGTWGEAGIVLIAGTGSIACSCVPETGEVHRAGGWGYVFGDEGSGYDIGRRALNAVMREFDGRGGRTLLTPRVLAHFGLDGAAQLVTRVYEDPEMRRTVAELAPVVAAAASEGDRTAIDIMEYAARELAELAGAVAARTAGRTLPVVLSGGLFAIDSLRRRVTESIAALSGVGEVILPALPPVVGAYVSALRAGGVPLTNELKAAVAREWNALCEEERL